MMRNCPFCGAPIEERLVEHVHRQEGELRILRNVPAEVCVQCGETFLGAEALKAMDAIDADKREPDEYLAVPVYSIRALDRIRAKSRMDSPR